MGSLLHRLALSVSLTLSLLQSCHVHSQEAQYFRQSSHACFVSSNSSGTPTAREVAALLAFKGSIQNDTHGHMANWTIANASNVCLTWMGVTCNSGGQVIGIDLSSSRLEGTVTTMIGDLVCLKSLNLCYNSLHGSVPAELLSLPKLEKLFLGFNNFTGPIPEFMRNSCPALTYLDIRFNQMSGSIPQSLGRFCRNLQSLYLSDNLLSGSVPTTLGELKQVDELWLNDNRITGEILHL